jgi:hypothetical protein
LQLANIWNLLRVDPIKMILTWAKIYLALPSHA